MAQLAALLHGIHATPDTLFMVVQSVPDLSHHFRRGPMTPLIQICVVLITAAFIGVSIMTMRAMARIEKAADEFSRTAQSVQRSMAMVEDVTHEIHDLVGTVGKATPPLRRAVSMFGELGERLARLSSALVDEVEAPVRNVLAVARGVRSGTAFFVNRLTQRNALRHQNQGNHQQGGLGHV
jgi:hypothetical protein